MLFILTLFIWGASCVAMYRLAEAEGQSGIKWGLLTGVIIFFSMWFVPIVLLDVLIGFVVSFILMMFTKRVA